MQLQKEIKYSPVKGETAASHEDRYSHFTAYIVS